jgi:copper chaperone CopZ
MSDSENQKPDCCTKQEKKGEGLWSGIAYGLIPHVGCIAFIVFTVLGVTVATSLLKPLLLNPYFFYILIGLSLVFTTISAAYYLRRNGLLSAAGARKKWKYLSVLYGTALSVNLLLFMVIFPYATNFMAKPIVTGALAATPENLQKLTLQVAIPCPGHAPLITDELNTINGVTSVEFKFPNIFDVTYDTTQTSKEQILSLEVFKTYKATVVGESSSASTSLTQTQAQTFNTQTKTSGGCCGGSGTCDTKPDTCDCGGRAAI